MGLPNGLVLFVPFAVLIIWAQRRTGFGRLLYAIGSNEAAARLSGVRVWQVHLALYALSGLIAGLTGLLYLGLIKTASLSLALPLDLPSVAAAVIGGTSIFGGRGGYGGTIIGALILTVLATMLTLMQMPEGGRRILFGADHPGRHRAVHPPDRPQLKGGKSMAKFRIVGISFDHMHMGDLLRLVHDHPDAEIAGIFDPDRSTHGRAPSRTSASRRTGSSPTSTPAWQPRNPTSRSSAPPPPTMPRYTERLAAYGVPCLCRKTLRRLGRRCPRDDRGDGADGQAAGDQLAARLGARPMSPPSG